jgi:nitric oxide reductase NorQ protein
MRNGTILYLDELNAAEADVLLRLDEALDDRRQVVLKESEGQTITASKGWTVIATINPLSHVGTKELPPQVLSRFPVRLRLEYPPEEVEVYNKKTYFNQGLCISNRENGRQTGQ